MSHYLPAGHYQICQDKELSFKGLPSKTSSIKALPGGLREVMVPLTLDYIKGLAGFYRITSRKLSIEFWA